jgi:hypothetical protein
MFGVGNGVTNDVLKEDLEELNLSSLLGQELYSSIALLILGFFMGKT